MNVAPHTRKTLLQLLVRLLFEAVPTVFIVYYTLYFLNQSFTLFETGLSWQAINFAIGLGVSYTLYFYRARFLVTFLLLWLVYILVDWIIGRMPGEFELFYTSVNFQVYSTLFIFGWICGFLLIRVRYSYIGIAALMGWLTFSSLSKDLSTDSKYFAINIVPVLAYTFYMIFAAPVLRDILDADWKKSGRLLVRALVFLLLVIGTILYVDSRFEREKEKIAEVLNKAKEAKNGKDGPGDYDEKNGLLERGNKGQKPDKGEDKDGGKDKGDDGEGGYKLKDTMSMSDRMSQSDYIMFCSKLHNYFPDGTPKPLYFVYHYLTKYDPKKESFIRDTAMPYFDEMKVDPSSLPMYRSKTDSSTIRNSLATKKRDIVEAEVFISSNTWKHALLAPATPFFCQTIPVDSSYKKMFRSAYKVRCYTSELNNAYFVYNPSGNPQLADMQEERFDELRSVPDYSKADPKLLNYYTDMPKGPLYDSIRKLALEITKNAQTPVDKVIAIRDYFLQTDKEGKRIYRYTLTPGAPSDPNIPNSTMLSNFLFRTHAGYCTYYAGASLFMLRSVGVPARFTTGFATIDRSDKNKGWYWFYASQAHAWTQVYFPGYGWLDFDMTIGNDDQKEAPKPDGTPPLPPPEPWLVIDGKAETAPGQTSKRLDVSFGKIIFYNEDFRLGTVTTREVDASVCRVLYGKKDTTLSAIHPGDSIIVVSYDDESKVIPVPKTGVGIDQQVADFPKPIIADEIHIKPKEDKKKPPEQKKETVKAKSEELTWGQIFVRLLYVVGGIILLILFTPFAFLWILLLRKSASGADPKKRADRAYRLALYHYHMAGVERGSETPMEYAATKADPFFHSNFTGFMQVYLRLKYGSGQLEPDDAAKINMFSQNIMSSARKASGFFTILRNYFNLSRANRYFRRPEEKPNKE